jgi:hypothetical protein
VDDAGRRHIAHRRGVDRCSVAAGNLIPAAIANPLPYPIKSPDIFSGWPRCW